MLAAEIFEIETGGLLAKNHSEKWIASVCLFICFLSAFCIYVILLHFSTTLSKLICLF